MCICLLGLLVLCSLISLWNIWDFANMHEERYEVPEHTLNYLAGLGEVGMEGKSASW